MGIITLNNKIILSGNKMALYNATVPSVEKGTLITMNLDGTDRQYRVLKNVGNGVHEVMTMWNISTSQKFHDSSQVYSGSDLDTYLNTTWYNTLSTAAKAVIVPNNITQYTYQYYDEPNTPNTPTYTYQYQYNWSNSDYENADKTAEDVVGDRYVYVLDLKDIFDYHDKVCITSDELMTMFFNSTDKVSTFIWLRSASADYSSSAWYVNGYGGYVSSYDVGRTSAVRGALQIDLSKISYTINS